MYLKRLQITIEAYLSTVATAVGEKVFVKELLGARNSPETSKPLVGGVAPTESSIIPLNVFTTWTSRDAFFIGFKFTEVIASSLLIYQ